MGLPTDIQLDPPEPPVTEGELAQEPEVGIRVVREAIGVLRYVAESRQPQGVRQIARALGITKSKVHRILLTLEMDDLVRSGEAGQYTLGPAVVSLAAQFGQGDRLYQAAIREMTLVWKATGESIALAVAHSDGWAVIAQLESSQPLRYVADVGRSYPFNRGATGRALLAAMPESEAEILMVASQKATHDGLPGKPLSLDALKRLVAEARARGYAESHSEWLPGAAALVVPVETGHRPYMAIAMYAPEQRLGSTTVAEHLELLTKAARGITSTTEQ